MKAEPVLNYVLLEREEAETVTKGGIIIPETAQEKPLRGKVVAFGNELSPNTKVKLGRTMLYKKYGGTDVVIDGKDYVVIKEIDLLLGL